MCTLFTSDGFHSGLHHRTWYTAKLKPEFGKRGVKVIGLSCDSLNGHDGWSHDIEETQGYAPNFPIMADDDRKVASLYSMIPPNASDTMTVLQHHICKPSQLATGAVQENC